MKKQNFIITSLFLFWVIGTTTAQTITGKVTNIHAQAIDGATVILQTIDSTFVDAVSQIPPVTSGSTGNQHLIG